MCCCFSPIYSESTQILHFLPLLPFLQDLISRFQPSLSLEHPELDVDNCREHGSNETLAGWEGPCLSPVVFLFFFLLQLLRQLNNYPPLETQMKNQRDRHECNSKATLRTHFSLTSGSRHECPASYSHTTPVPHPLKIIKLLILILTQWVPQLRV